MRRRNYVSKVRFSVARFNDVEFQASLGDNRLHSKYGSLYAYGTTPRAAVKSLVKKINRNKRSGAGVKTVGTL